MNINKSGCESPNADNPIHAHWPACSGPSCATDSATGIRRLRGFTLIELVVALVVFGILTAIAIPSYQRYVISSRRTAAQSEMLEIANRQKQILIINRQYATKSTLITSGYQVPAEVSAFYTWDVTVGAGTLPTFTITFTGIGAQAVDNDLGSLTLDSALNKAPAAKWK